MDTGGVTFDTELHPPGEGFMTKVRLSATRDTLGYDNCVAQHDMTVGHTPRLFLTQPVKFRNISFFLGTYNCYLLNINCIEWEVHSA